MQSENKVMKNFSMWISAFLLLIGTFSSCDKTNKESVAVPALPQSSYQINAPDKVWSLSSKLLEISGLAYDTTKKELIAINDEKGILFSLDTNKGEILSTQVFSKKGDYEGIEMVGDIIYVVESDGTLHEITDGAKSKKLSNKLKSSNDVEGLGYDATNAILLLACKGKPSINSEQKLKKTKVVYGYDVVNKEFKEDPVIIIADSTLLQFFDAQLSSNIDNSRSADYKKRLKSFAPSAIAYNKNDNSYYILSSVGKTMVVLDQENNIKSIDFLDNKLHRQPEGMVFDEDHNLYISNEGKFGVAKIFKYNF